MGKRLSILALCLIALMIVAQGCGQPAPEVSTATLVPPTDPPAATEPGPTEDPTATLERRTATAVPPTEPPTATEPSPTEEPTATPEPTATEEPAATEERHTPTAPPREELEPTAAPVEEGWALLEERCTVCHTLDRVERSQKSREEWESTVARMVGRGAQLTDDERAVLIDYLTARYGS
jgi:cytochrome c5